MYDINVLYKKNLTLTEYNNDIFEISYSVVSKKLNGDEVYGIKIENREKQAVIAETIYRCSMTKNEAEELLFFLYNNVTSVANLNLIVNDLLLT